MEAYCCHLRLCRGALPRGQFEAAESLGLRHGQALRWIILVCLAVAVGSMAGLLIALIRVG